ncbi:MAG: hypothetical protein ACOCT0_04395 [Halobacteriota archaeon]
MAAIDEGREVKTQATRRVLEQLDDDQKTEVVREIARHLVTEMKNEDPERVAKKVGRAVLDTIPVVSQITPLRTTTTLAVDAYLEDNSEEIVDEVASVIVGEIIDSHAEGTVDHGVAAIVDQVSRRS